MTYEELMALEFKLGGEILRTVVVRDMAEIMQVGAIILLRAALTFLIHWEIKNEAAEIEKEHANRFKMFQNLMEENKMFSGESDTKWMCLNCGFVYEGEKAPEKCPVCDHDKGYFIRMTLSPFVE